MNVIEKQAELGRTLFQINTGALRGMFEVQRDNVEKYFELNRAYVEKLPEVKDIGSFIALQRDYNESFWTGFRSSVQNQTDLVKDVLVETGTALKSAFTRADEREAAQDSEETASKAKARTRTAKADDSEVSK